MLWCNDERGGRFPPAGVTTGYGKTSTFRGFHKGPGRNEFFNVNSGARYLVPLTFQRMIIIEASSIVLKSVARTF